MSKSKNDVIVNKDNTPLAVAAEKIITKITKPANLKVKKFLENPKLAQELSALIKQLEHKEQTVRHYTKLSDLYIQIGSDNTRKNIQALEESNQEGFNTLTASYKLLRQELRNKKHEYKTYFNSIKYNPYNIQDHYPVTMGNATQQLEKFSRTLTFTIANETAKSVDKENEFNKLTNNQLSEIVSYAHKISDDTGAFLFEIAENIINSTKQQCADLSEIIIQKDMDTTIDDIQIKAPTDYVLTSEVTGEIIPKHAKDDTPLVLEIVSTFSNNISNVIKRVGESIDMAAEQITTYQQEKLANKKTLAKTELEKNQTKFDNVLIMIDMLQEQIVNQLKTFVKVDELHTSVINQYLTALNKLKNEALEHSTYDPLTLSEVEKISSAVENQFRILRTDAQKLFKNHLDALNNSINEQLDEFSNLSNFNEKKDELTSYLQEQIKLFNASVCNPSAFETIEKDVQQKLSNLIHTFKDKKIDLDWAQLHNYRFTEKDKLDSYPIDSKQLSIEKRDINNVPNNLSNVTNSVLNTERTLPSKEEKLISSMIKSVATYKNTFIKNMISDLNNINASEMNTKKGKVAYCKAVISVLEKHITEKNLSSLTSANKEPFINFIRACLQPLNGLIKNLTGKKYAPQLFGASSDEVKIANAAQIAHTQLDSLLKNLEPTPSKPISALNPFTLK